MLLLATTAHAFLGSNTKTAHPPKATLPNNLPLASTVPRPGSSTTLELSANNDDKNMEDMMDLCLAWEHDVGFVKSLEDVLDEAIVVFGACVRNRNNNNPNNIISPAASPALHELQTLIQDMTYALHSLKPQSCAAVLDDDEETSQKDDKEEQEVMFRSRFQISRIVAANLQLYEEALQKGGTFHSFVMNETAVNNTDGPLDEKAQLSLESFRERLTTVQKKLASEPKGSAATVASGKDAAAPFPVPIFENNERPDTGVLKEFLKQLALFPSNTNNAKSGTASEEIDGLTKEIKHILVYASIGIEEESNATIADNNDNNMRSLSEISKDLDEALQLHLKNEDDFSADLLQEFISEYKAVEAAKGPMRVRISAASVMDAFQGRMDALKVQLGVKDEVVAVEAPPPPKEAVVVEEPVKAVEKKETPAAVSKVPVTKETAKESPPVVLAPDADMSDVDRLVEEALKEAASALEFADTEVKPKKTSQVVQQIAGMAFDGAVKGVFGFAKNFAQMSQKKSSGDGAGVIASGAPSNPTKASVATKKQPQNVADPPPAAVSTPIESTKQPAKRKEAVITPPEPATPQSRPPPGVLPFFAAKAARPVQVQIGASAAKEDPKAVEAQKAEEAALRKEKQERLARELKQAEEKQKAEATAREMAAQEAKIAEKAMLEKEAARVEKERIAQEAKKAEEEKVAQAAIRAQQERQLLEKKREEQEQQAVAAEKERLAQIAKEAEKAMLEKEAARVEKERLAQEAKKAAEEKAAQAAIKEQQERMAFERRQAEQKRQAEAAEKERLAQEAKAAEQEMLKKEAARVEKERQAQQAKKAAEEKAAQAAIKEQQERMALERRQAEQKQQAQAAELERKMAEAQKVEAAMLAKNRQQQQQPQQVPNDPLAKFKAASSVQEVKFARDRKGPTEPIADGLSAAERIAREQYARSEEKRLKAEALNRAAERRRIEESIRAEEVKRENFKAERLQRESAIREAEKQTSLKAEQDRLDKEAKVKAEAERLAQAAKEQEAQKQRAKAEEAARVEEQKRQEEKAGLEREEKARLEAAAKKESDERLAAEVSRKEEARLAQEAAAKKELDTKVAAAQEAAAQKILEERVAAKARAGKSAQAPSIQGERTSLLFAPLNDLAKLPSFLDTVDDANDAHYYLMKELTKPSLPKDFPRIFADPERFYRVEDPKEIAAIEAGKRIPKKPEPLARPEPVFKPFTDSNMAQTAVPRKKINPLEPDGW